MNAVGYSKNKGMETLKKECEQILDNLVCLFADTEYRKRTHREKINLLYREIEIYERKIGEFDFGSVLKSERFQLSFNRSYLIYKDGTFEVCLENNTLSAMSFLDRVGSATAFRRSLRGVNLRSDGRQNMIAEAVREGKATTRTGFKYLEIKPYT